MMPEGMEKLLHAFNSLADLGQEIAETRDSEEMARSALHVVLGTLAVRRGVVAEYDATKTTWRVAASRGLKQELIPITIFDKTDALELKSAGASGLLLMSDGTFANTEMTDAVALRAKFLRELGIELATPLIVRDDLIGAILLGGKASGEGFSEGDREIVGTLAHQIGVGLHQHKLLREVEERAEENRRLYDEMHGIYRDTVRAFAAAIDCKDRYTRGHSERVGKYSEIIAREMGWSEDRIEGMAIAGYLHDVGKLAVDRDIINAPYKIDAKKSSELNRHPAVGYEILAPIRHPHADIPLSARYHPERIDGRGYPEGLTGDQIPLGAKIVTLADSFDAMTTDRPYKRRRVFEEVVEDLRKNTGKQFAAEVVAPFCRALLREMDGNGSPKPITRLLGKDYVNHETIKPLLAELIEELEIGALVATGAV